ncbi:MAG: ABC transporter ATP-binding protein [Subdoligranulum sp.]|nr:ABC transporter ATP-binding protein [Subdoligranulum sp.]
MTYYLKKFWKQNLVVLLIQIVMYGLISWQSLVQIQMFQAIFDWNTHRFLMIVALNTGIWLTASVLEILCEKSASHAILVMNNQVRRDMAATLLHKTHQDYHAQESGEYLSWLTTGVERIEDSAWNSFVCLTAYVTRVITSLVALATLHWSLLLASVAVGLILLALPQLFQKRMERLGEVCAQEQAAATGKLKELLGGFDVLCFFGRKDRFLRGIEQASDQIEEPKYRQAYIQRAVSAGVIGNVQTLLTAGTTVLVAILSLKGIIIQAALTGTGNLCSYVSSGIKEIAALRLGLASSKAYFDRITVHDDGVNCQSKTGIDPVQNTIAVENLSFKYGEKPILQNLSFQFQKGGKFALTGPSGCGKSTLLKLLLGWLPDYGGAIRFDGKDAKDFTPEQLQQQMSYIEQNVFLFNSTIRDNITLGETFTDEQMEKALRDSALAGDLASMPDGLDTIVGEEGGNLSGGQKQRVAIARALIHDRSILLVDEGTSALDQKNADIVEKSLLANPDLTLILVSHHLTPERKGQFTQVYDLQPVAPHLQSA